MAATGSVGQLQLAIPKLGYAVAVFTIPGMRLMFVSLAALLLGAVVLRRLWAEPR